MNNYKLHLDTLYSKLSTYMFSVKRIETLLTIDAKQLENGGDFFDISSIHIRDWSNFSNSNWQINYKKTAFLGKEEYLNEINKIKNRIYSFYLLETYERLLDFISEIFQKNRNDAKIHNIVKWIDYEFQNRKTPFGFNIITFIFVFSKIRNAITHNEGQLDIKSDFSCYEYLKDFDINKKVCDRFIEAYFQSHVDNSQNKYITVLKNSFKDIMEFTKSFSFELFRFYSTKDGLDWRIKNDSESLDIKTNLPLTESQIDYMKYTIQKHFGKEKGDD